MRSTRDFPKLSSPAVLSPMAGVTDVAFRALCKRYGAGMTTTEFVSSEAVVRGNVRALSMVATDPSESPVAVQLFGSNAMQISAAAQRLEERFDVIDVNCGCPAWKVIKTGAGSQLLNDPKRIGSFISTLSSATSRPVTVKIRSGIDSQHVNAVEVARQAEDAGAAAVAVHGRTQKQAYRGHADWDLIRQVKEAVDIPVIGNGDVLDVQTFNQRLEESGVDAIMIARGAIGNPGIFRDIVVGKSESRDRLAQFREYVLLAQKYDLPFSAIKRHALSFTKGMVGGAALRRAATQEKDVQGLMDALEQ